MSKRVDFFEPEHKRLALPGATTMVFLDGTLCEALEPLEIVRGGWPEFASARLAYNPAASLTPDVLTPERIEDRFGPGRTLSLRQVYNPIPPDTAVASLPVFVGHIEGIETRIGPDTETVEIVAKDFSAALQRVTVYGQHSVCVGSAPVFLAGLATAFNPGGRGNATGAPVVVEGRPCTLFSTAAADGRLWSYAEVLDYLLSRHIPIGRLHWPDLEQLRALTDNRHARDLDVTGLSLLEALHRCCEEAGLEFRFAPRLAETGPSQTMLFYRNGQGRCVELNCQRKGQSLALSRTNIAALHGRREFYPVTHRYIGQGDYKVYEATFELVQAWDPALESTDYSTFSASTNAQFHQVEDVYRKWCLNEAGDYTGAPFNCGPAYDFSKLFETDSYLRRRRRFWPALSTDGQDQSLGYFLEVSFDDGAHWWRYLHAFNNLLDECGIWLSSDQLDVDTWVAALKGMLRFRITASIVSDERLACVVADGPVGSTVPVVDHVVTLPRRFKYRNVSPESVLAQPEGAGVGTPDEADDSAALQEFIRHRAAASPAIIERVDVRTCILNLHFQPGDRVTTCPESRDLLGCRRDNRSVVWIERVHVDFQNQCTNLAVVRQRT
jgi:hypothetical protein